MAELPAHWQGIEPLQIAMMRRYSKSAQVSQSWEGRPAVSAPASIYAETLTRLRHHPQDHGWRALFAAMDFLLHEGSVPLVRILDACAVARPKCSASHILTLLGMSLKAIADNHPQAGAALFQSTTLRDHARVLEGILQDHEEVITQTLLTRQNSFTGVRRFLVPQVIFARYLRRCGVKRANLLDVGTGLGLLPRQLNSRTVFERFAPELVWPFGIPRFQTIPIGSRIGIDRSPLPDLQWVRNCYGPSRYYDALFQELLWVVHRPEVTTSDAVLVEMDMLDLGELRALIRRERIQAINCSFVLYQYESAVRSEVIAEMVTSMVPPGLLISMEPRGDLTLQGCQIVLYGAGVLDPIRFATVSDSHFVGQVLRADHYDAFTKAYL